MDDNLNKTLNKLDETLKNMAREVTSSLDNESPKWNASHIGDIPLDITHKKNGWGFLYNDGKFDMFPIGESKFYEHNELSGYKKEEHIPLNDSKTSTQNLWSSKRTLEEIIKETNKLLEGEIKEAKKQSNITLNKTVKKNRVEIERNIEDVKRQATMLLKRLEGSEVELSIAKDNIAKLGALRNDNSGIEQLWRQISTLETQLSALVDLKVGKVRDVVYTKGELNRKFKEVSERITRISKKTSNGKLTDEEIKNLIEDKTPWGHEHMAKEVKYNGQRLSEYLDNLSVGDGLPDQTGNSGKYLTTDGTDASWATLAGGGDMAAATYDPQGIAGDAFSTDNHTDGTTNKVFTATEKTKLSGIAESANNYTHPNHSGDVTSVADGATTIANGVVSLAKMANLAANTVIGRVTASTGVPEALTATNVRTIINVEDGADVTDATNVAAAGAVMDSELIATSAGAGDAGKPIKLDAEGHVDATMINDADISLDSVTEGSTNKFYTSTEKTKLSGIETAADVTDATNVSAAGAPIITSGAGAPASTPSKVGDIYVDTTGDDAYIAVGTASSSDWEKSNDGAGGGISDGDKGDITVSGSGATWTIDNDAVTYAKIQDVSATDRILGRDTAGAGVIEELTPTAVRSMINVADGANAYVHPNHSGDVTSVADGATTIANGAVSLAKMANLAANTIIGRVTASTGVPEALTAANVRTIINVENGADVTDTTNVTAAGALMDSEVDADLKTLSLPANTTISTYAASFLDDANEATFKATVNLEIGTDVQAYDANNATASSTTTFTNKTIDANGTGNSITNLEVADFTAAAIVTATDTIATNNNDTTIPTSAAVKAYADSVGGGAVPGTLVVFKPAENEPPATNFATIDTRNAHPVLDFDAATNESAVFSGIMPSYYGGGGVTVYIHYAMTSATSGDIDWDVAFERIGDQQLDIDSDSFAAVNSVDNTTVPGTSGNVDVVTIAFTDGADMDSVAAGEGFRLKITRDAASDTATGDAELLYLEIRETAA